MTATTRICRFPTLRRTCQRPAALVSLLSSAIVLFTLLCPVQTQAQSTTQQREIIFGVVRDSAGSALVASDVVLTVGGTFQVLRTNTDSSGRFRIVVDSASGAGAGGGRDFLLAVIAPGYELWRQRVTLPAGSDSVGVQVVVAHASRASLAAFAVVASRPAPRDLNRSLGARGGAAEMVTSEGTAVAAAGDAGDILQSVALNPTLYSADGGIGALGLGGDQSRVTINGLPATSMSMTRDMRRRVRTGVTNYDPAVGGFSAASVTVELLRGGTISLPQIRISQDGDMNAYGTGLTSSQTGRRTVLSYTNSGEAIPDRMAYNIGLSAARRDRRAQALGLSETQALRSIGISQNTLNALSAQSIALGVPYNTSSAAGISTDSYSTNGRLDWLRGPLGPIALTFGASYSQADMPQGVFQNASRSLNSDNKSASLQLSSQRSTQNGWLVDWRLGGSIASSGFSPSLAGPAFNIRLDSDSAEGITGGLGGAGISPLTTSRRTLESAWQAERVVQLPIPGTHQLKLFAQAQVDNASNKEGPSSGVFEFATLESFYSSSPSSFSRVIDYSKQQASSANFALGIGDLWRPRRFFNIQLGLRADMGAVLGNLRSSWPIESLGLAKPVDHRKFVPLLSPRVGFTWTYAGEKAEGAYLTSSNFGSSANPGSGQLRGGFGLFRSYWNVDEALLVTAPNGASQQMLLTCGVGSVPTANWYSSEALAPTQCSSGSITPIVRSSSHLAGGAAPPAAWRGNLTLTHTPIRRLNVELGVVASYGINQRAIVDRNFPTTPSFVLGNEDGRGSFRRVEDIDPSTGFPISQINRPITSYGSLYERLATGRNRAHQVSLSLIPNLRSGWQFRVSSAYTRTEQFNVSSGYIGTGAEPLDRLHWMTTPGVPSWRSVVEFGKIGQKYGLTGVARVDAGARYTPVVAGDINGDGIATNDRAFVFAEYLSGGSSRMPGAARSCLQKQVNSIASTGSCTLPAAFTADLAFSYSPSPAALMKRGAGRVSYTIRVSNVPAIIDRAVNRNSHGWGRAGSIDPVLATVQAFNPVTRTFSYTQNPNFGKASLNSGNRWAPYFVSIDAQIFLGASVADQQAVRTLKRSNVAGARLSEVDSIVAQLRKTFADPYNEVLMESDSLLLNREQIEALYVEQRALNAKVDSVWRTAAVRLAPSADRISNRQAGELLQAKYDEVIKTLREGVKPLQTILSAKQVARAPGNVRALLAGRNPLFMLR